MNQDDLPTPSQLPPTAEEVARHYKSALDSVKLLLGAKPEAMPDEDWVACVTANVTHLEQLAQNPWWDGYDLSPFFQAINVHKQGETL